MKTGLQLQYWEAFPLNHLEEAFNEFLPTVADDVFPEMFANLKRGEHACQRNGEDRLYNELKFIRVGRRLDLIGTVERAEGLQYAHHVATQFGLLLAMAAAGAGASLRPGTLTVRADYLEDGPDGESDELGRVTVKPSMRGRRERTLAIGWGDLEVERVVSVEEHCPSISNSMAERFFPKNS